MQERERVQRRVYVSTFECTSMCVYMCVQVCVAERVRVLVCEHGVEHVKLCTEAYTSVCECRGVVKCVSVWGVWPCKRVRVQECVSVSTA